MAAPWIVQAVDEVEDGESVVRLIAEALPIEQLALEGCEEALTEGVVVGVAHAAHRGPDAGLLTPDAEGDRRVLAALVRVMNDVGGPTLLDGHVQGRPDELGAPMPFHGPPGHPPPP